MKKSRYTLVCLILLASGLPGQELSNIPGAFSEAGFGVRPSGMGQAYTAVSNDANAFLTNPAGLLTGTRPAFTANYARLFGIVPSGYFGLLYPLQPRLSLGAGFLFAGDDALMENTLGVSLAATFPNPRLGGNEIYFDQMSFGVTVKGRWASFGNNSDGGANRVTGSGAGYALDFGYLLRVNRKLSFGVMLRDFFNRFNWNSSVSGEYSEKIPATARLGIAYQLDGITVAADLRKNLHDDTANRVYFGVEKTVLDLLVLRGGFSNNLGTDDLNRRWSFGFTLLRSVLDNYALGISGAYGTGNLDNLFRFGLDLAWGKTRNRPPAGRIY